MVAGNNQSDCEPGNRVRVATTYAFVAGTGHLLWSRSSHGPARCTTSAPAISGTWVYSAGLDDRIHRYALLTGKEYLRHGWPEFVSLSPRFEKISSRLSILGARLYATTSGYTGHPGRYQGHLVAIDLKNGSRVVWNSLCSHYRSLLSPLASSPTYCPFRGSGIWARYGVQLVPSSGDIILATGNGPWNGRTNWGDSLIELSPDGRRFEYFFTPDNSSYLSRHDLDLGSTTPALLPPFRSRGRIFHLAVQGGKGPSGSAGGPVVLRLLDLDRFSHAGGSAEASAQVQVMQAPYGCAVLTAPAIWRPGSGGVEAIYANDCGAAAYRIVVGPKHGPRLRQVWEFFSTQHLTTPVVSNNLLYLADSGSLGVYDPRTGKRLWSTSRLGPRRTIGNIHWEYPAVHGDMVFMTDERGRIYAYKRSG